MNLRAIGIVLPLALGGCDYLGDVGGGSIGTSAAIPLPELIVPPVADEVATAVLDDARIRDLLVEEGADPGLIDELIDAGFSMHEPLDLSDRVGIPASIVSRQLGRWADDALDDIEAEINEEVRRDAPAGVDIEVELRTLGDLVLPMPRGRSIFDAWTRHLRDEHFELRLRLTVRDIGLVDLPDGLQVSPSDLERYLSSVEISSISLRTSVPDLESDSGIGGKRSAAKPGVCGVERLPLDWLARVDGDLRRADAPNEAPAALLAYVATDPASAGCEVEVGARPSVPVLEHVVGGFTLDLSVVMTTPVRRTGLEGDVRVRVFTAPGPLVDTVRELLRLFSD